jgi:hypothetical protein
VRKLLVFLWLALWLYLCLIPTLESGTASYLAWRDAGCPDFGGTVARPFCPAPASLFRSLLMWALTAPLLGWALWRTPRAWPAKLRHLGWNQARPLLSAGTLLLCLVVLGSVWIGALRAPFAAAAVSNYVALAPIALLAFWYRAVLLSAEDETE